MVGPWSEARVFLLRNEIAFKVTGSQAGAARWQAQRYAGFSPLAPRRIKSGERRGGKSVEKKWKVGVYGSDSRTDRQEQCVLPHSPRHII